MSVNIISFLVEHTGCSPTRVRKWIDAGIVWSRGVTVLSSKSALLPDQQCAIDLTLLDSIGALLPLQPQILFDSPEFLAINKPASCESLDLKSILERQLGFSLVLVHRLDRMTSGVILFAKSQDAKRRLDRAFVKQEIRKVYCALCHVHPESKMDSIPSIADKKWAHWEDFLLKKRDKLYSCFVEKTENQRGAELASLHTASIQSKPKAALMAFHLHSGKMHQIRAQSLCRSLAIVGDRQYRNHEQYPEFQKLAYGGHFLHAYWIQVPKSCFGQTLEICAPFPSGWGQALLTAGIKGRSLDRIINPSTPPEARKFSDKLDQKVLTLLAHSPQKTVDAPRVARPIKSSKKPLRTSQPGSKTSNSEYSRVKKSTTGGRDRRGTDFRQSTTRKGKSVGSPRFTEDAAGTRGKTPAKSSGKSSGKSMDHSLPSTIRVATGKPPRSVSAKGAGHFSGKVSGKVPTKSKSKSQSVRPSPRGKKK